MLFSIFYLSLFGRRPLSIRQTTTQMIKQQQQNSIGSFPCASCAPFSIRSRFRGESALLSSQIPSLQANTLRNPRLHFFSSFSASRGQGGSRQLACWRFSCHSKYEFIALERKLNFSYFRSNNRSTTTTTTENRKTN